MHNYLIIIGGPTASGKTELSLRLAEHFQTEILSCDSRQFYREMSIGTAKPTPAELARAPHHFVNSLSITTEYTVADYERDAIELLEKLFEQHRIVIMVGGSGLFINAVTEGLNEFPQVPPTVRQELEFFYEKHGLAGLQRELAQRDPDYFMQVDTQNPRRLIRALEICRATNQPFSFFRNQPRPVRDFQPIYITLEWDRAQLYDRINRRVDLMLEVGLEEEARQLFPQRHLKSLQTVGYQELFQYFAGEINQEEAMELIKRNSRRYAKRQLTWLRREAPRWQKFNATDSEAVIEYVEMATKVSM
ncbi:MAG: tRNA (adenosine(37)-N6)-dimethylallyltransferase MiaA [Saprospiraceae bacterium]